jgi:hypothetical protein
MPADTPPTGGTEVKTLVEALKKNADRLGLKWQIRVATVSAAGTASSVTGVFDGDSTDVPLIPLLPVFAGLKVYVLATDTGGNYVIGLANARSYPDAPRAHITRSNAQSIANNTLVDVDYDTEDRDTDNMVDLFSNNSVIRIQVAGDYIAGANAAFATNVTGIRHMVLYQNTTALAYDTLPADAIGATGLNTYTQATFAVGDTISCQLRQNSGAALNTSVFVLAALFCAYVGPAHN